MQRHAWYENSWYENSFGVNATMLLTPRSSHENKTLDDCRAKETFGCLTVVCCLRSSVCWLLSLFSLSLPFPKFEPTSFGLFGSDGLACVGQRGAAARVGVGQVV